MLTTFNVMSQTIVVTTPQCKNVVLEEFTGINCPHCPSGHALAQKLSDENPNRVVLVNIHQGNYAAPNSGQADYRTLFGDALAVQANIPGYPTGTVNRRLFPELTVGTTTSLNRSAWATAAAYIFPEQSPVNIGFTSQFDTNTRLLTVMVELYYTANSATPTNYINIALLENHILGYQANGTGSPNYDHKHMLRHFITGQWGDTCKTTTAGSFFTKTYTYTVPVEYNIDNCDIAVYVAESHQNIMTGVVAPAKGGTHNGNTDIYIGTLVPTINIIDDGTPNDTTTLKLSATSSLASTENFKFTLTSDAPNDWTENFVLNGTTYTSTATIGMTLNTANNIIVNVIPGKTPALATYTLIMSSVSNPTASFKIQKIYVISGITDLVVRGSGSWGDDKTYNFDKVYSDGLTFANNKTFAITTANIMEKGFSAKALDSVKHIYMNIGWSFPTITDKEATALMSFMDKGGNLFITGQDIGWDIMSGKGYGDTITKFFYTNYLHAAWENDGDATNNQFNAVAFDTVFKIVSASAIVDVYNGNMYPDQIKSVGIGKNIFYYNGNPSKNCGIRATNGISKTVYLGVEPAMLSDTIVKKQVIKLAHDWFHGLINSVEYNEAMLKLSMKQNYPNPSNTLTIIPISNLNKDVTFQIIDLTGRIISEQIITKKTTQINVNTKNIKNGMYLYRLIDGSETIAVKPMQVIH